MAISQSQIKTFVDAYDYFPGPNYVVQWEDGDTAQFKSPAIDEFIRLIAFEQYKSMATGLPDSEPVDPALAEADTDTLRLIPANTGSPDRYADSGATWFVFGTGAVTDSDLSFGTVDADFESFDFTAVGARIEVAAAAANVPASAEARFSGLARLMAARELGRKLVNGDGASNTLKGLYGHLGASSSYSRETQVKAASGFLDARTGIRNILRLVSTSGSGFGQGANALLMTPAMVEWLRSSGAGTVGDLSYLPDQLNPGEYRLHFDGVPVYLAPIREDEESTGLHATTQANSNVRTSVYAVRVGGSTGVRILYLEGDPSNHGLQTTSEKDVSTGNRYYQAVGRYTLFVPEHTAIARLWGIDMI